MSLVFDLLLVVVCSLHLVSSQHCSLPLQCSGGGDHVDPGQSTNLGVPGKRGPKGEKGDSYGGNTEIISELMERLASVQDRLNSTEAELEVQKDKLEKLGSCKTESQSSPAFTLVTAGVLKIRSCKDVAELLEVKINGTYKVQTTSSLPPFNVHCGFNGNIIYTSIEHDSEDEIQIDNCDPARCYGRAIKYDVTIPQIRALMKLSGECRQFIKYRCIGSILRDGYGGWDNWNGELRHHWGGGEGRDGYCACGITGTCAECENGCGRCNCDVNRGHQEDSGYLTKQDDLPVTKLYFGDAGAPSESGFHTLGRLECFQ